MDPLIEEIKMLCAEVVAEFGEQETRPHDPYDGHFMLFESEHCTFEVLDRGVWYKVDAQHISKSLYHDVPDSVLDRVRERVGLVDRGNSKYGIPDTYEDRSPHYEKELREEFDDVCFVGCNILWGGRLLGVHAEAWADRRADAKRRLLLRDRALRRVRRLRRRGLRRKVRRQGAPVRRDAGLRGVCGVGGWTARHAPPGGQSAPASSVRRGERRPSGASAGLAGADTNGGLGTARRGRPLRRRRKHRAHVAVDAPASAQGLVYGCGAPLPPFRTNEWMQVCDENDEPIPGLYNNGCMVGDMFSAAYSGAIPGFTYGSSITFGYMTGKYIAENE